MDNTIITTPEEWIMGVCKEKSTSFKSIHFDSFISYKDENLKGLSLIKYVGSLIKEVRNVIEKENPSLKYKPLIYLPLGSTKNLAMWQDLNWEKVGSEDEPPSLYLLPTKDLFDVYAEEYKCPVNFPFNKENRIQALFRCSRDCQSIQNDWEFSSGIYIYHMGDF